LSIKNVPYCGLYIDPKRNHTYNDLVWFYTDPNCMGSDDIVVAGPMLLLRRSISVYRENTVNSCEMQCRIDRKHTQTVR
jgi:hypothetical protein